MDSRTILDHVLFQLTPTRTRCDLVIYGGGVSEKLASGLLQPFLSHLKTAQQQISKGGYSISLTPPSNSSHWFTKPTFQRFVRFVSTPEVLERFVTIEKELDQIENSVQSNDNPDAQGGNGSHPRAGSSDIIQEDNSKVRLHRALETRKAVLRKEQAMAYARALVTGFDLDSINDLISFADAFGASRLREACLNFMELCKRKNQDRLWMDEIAAMEASRLELPFFGTSGIVLASEENLGNGLSIGKMNHSIDASDSSHGSVDLNQDGQSMDSKVQVPMPWPDHNPQYMNNFQGPIYPQMLSYSGYMYPGMQYRPPYFPRNIHWPPNADDYESEDRKTKKSSSRNKKSTRGKRHETSVQDNSTDPSDSCSGTESDENSQKKHGKKSSRKVFIKNINYITSKNNVENESMSNETSDGDEFIGEAIKQRVEEAVGALGRQHKSTSRNHKKSNRHAINESHDEDNKGNDAWGAFQNILLQDKDLDASESEQRPSQLQDYSESEQKRNQRAISSDSFLAVTRETSSQAEFHRGSFEASENLRPLRTKNDSTYEELLFSQRNEGSNNCTEENFSGHLTESLMIKGQKEEDWFFSKQQDKSVSNGRGRAFDGDYDSHSRSEESKKSSPVDDSFFIQNRSLVDDQPEPILRREISMDADIVEATQYENGDKSKSNDKSGAFNAHEPDDLHMVLGRDLATGNAISSWTREMDYENDPLSTEANEIHIAKDKPSSNTKTGPGGKLPGKETMSKISNGTSRTKKPTPAGKPSIPKSKNKEEETRKRLEELSIQRQKRIAERSATAASKRLPMKKTQSPKPENPKLQPENKKTVFRSSTIDRLAAARVAPKVESVQPKTVQPKKPTSKANGSSQKTTAAEQKRLSSDKVKPDVPQKKESKVAAAQKPMNSIDEFKDIKELQSIDPIEKNEENVISQTETKDDKGSLYIDSKGNDEGLSKEAAIFQEDVKTTEMSIHPVPESPNIDFSGASVREISVRSDSVTWAEKSEIQISTTPPEEIIPAPVHSRKKWNSEETSPKAAKGFRKLLLFGRKSRSSTVSMA